MKIRPVTCPEIKVKSENIVIMVQRSLKSSRTYLHQEMLLKFNMLKAINNFRSNKNKVKDKNLWMS